MTASTQWHEYWAHRTSPQHRASTVEHYSQYGAELRVLWHGRRVGRVLEIGCGDGALYDHLGFDQCRYRGVDFSRAMLECFRARHPQVDAVEADGAGFCDDSVYDLIFSNGVVQYFDARMLDSHLAKARSMLAPSGLLVMASLPWKRLRAEFRGGLFTRGAWHWRHWLRTGVGSLRYGDSRWYDFRDVSDPARRHGFDSLFHGSMLYPYRFHAVLRPR